MNNISVDINLNDAQFNSLICLFIGVVFFITGLTFLLKRIRIQRNGVKTVGTMMELIPDKYSRGVPILYPVISFVTENNQTILKKYEVGKTNYNYKVGDDVPVIYNKANPEEFIIDDITSKFLGPLFSVVGFISIVISVIYIILKS